MILTGFSCENFRNIKTADLSFGEGVSLFSGDNAQGKTNAVEGIYLFARGKSFRGAADKDLVRFGENGFRLKISYRDKTGDHSLEYAFFDGERRRMKDGYRIDKMTDMIGHFRAVLFTPDDLSMVKDGPEVRRAFLNVAISQCYPLYMKQYAAYKRALDERNCVLKMANRGYLPDKNELYAWSKTLSEYAAYLYLARKNYIEKLSGSASALLFEMTGGKDELSLSYRSDIPENVSDKETAEKLYFEKFTSETDREIAVGTTLFGPSHDDMEILIGGISARNFASQGQQRSVVLALKCAEGEVVKEVCGEYPVFLFDDVLSELDAGRRKFVLSGMEQKQILMTSCEKDGIENIEQTFTVEGGRYVSSRGKR